MPAAQNFLCAQPTVKLLTCVRNSMLSLCVSRTFGALGALPPYTPVDHPMRPSDALLQHLERSRFQPPHVRNVSRLDVYWQHAPVEANFFSRRAPVDCIANAQPIPPRGDRCDHEPKFRHAHPLL